MEKQIHNFLNFILTQQVGNVETDSQKGKWRYEYDGATATITKTVRGRTTDAVYDESREYCLVMAIEGLMDSRKLYAVVQNEKSGAEFPALAICTDLEKQLGKFYASNEPWLKEQLEGLV